MEFVKFSDIDWDAKHEDPPHGTYMHSLNPYGVNRFDTPKTVCLAAHELMKHFPGKFAVSGPGLSHVLTQQDKEREPLDVYLLKQNDGSHMTMIHHALDWLMTFIQKELGVLELLANVKVMDESVAEAAFERISKCRDHKSIWDTAIDEHIIKSEDGCITPHEDILAQGIKPIKMLLPDLNAEMHRKGNVITVSSDVLFTPLRFQPEAYTLEELAHANGNIGSISAIWTGDDDILLSPDALFAYTRGMNQVSLTHMCEDYAEKLLAECKKGFGIHLMIEHSNLPEPNEMGVINLDLPQFELRVMKHGSNFTVFGYTVRQCGCTCNAHNLNAVFGLCDFEYVVQDPRTLIEGLAQPPDITLDEVLGKVQSFLTSATKVGCVPTNAGIYGIRGAVVEILRERDISARDGPRLLELNKTHVTQQFEKKVGRRNWSDLNIKTEHVYRPVNEADIYGKYA